MKASDLANALLHSYLNAPVADVEDKNDRAITLLATLRDFTDGSDLSDAIEKMLDGYLPGEGGHPDLDALPGALINVGLTTSVRLSANRAAETGSIEVPRTPFNLKSAIASLYEELISLAGSEDAARDLLEVAARGRVG